MPKVYVLSTPKGRAHGFVPGLLEIKKNHYLCTVMAESNFIDYVKLQNYTSARINKENGRTMQCGGDFALRHTIDDFRY